MPEHQLFFSCLLCVISIFVCASLRPDNPKKTQDFLKILHYFCMRNLYNSLSMPPKLVFVFSPKIYSQSSTLQPVADLGLLQHLKWSFFVTAVKD